jgi:hypothetical protein
VAPNVRGHTDHNEREKAVTESAKAMPISIAKSKSWQAGTAFLLQKMEMNLYEAASNQTPNLKILLDSSLTTTTNVNANRNNFFLCLEHLLRSKVQDYRIKFYSKNENF